MVKIIIELPEVEVGAARRDFVCKAFREAMASYEQEITRTMRMMKPEEATSADVTDRLFLAKQIRSFSTVKVE